MARKPPSKETQIKMIRGALKSPKTPKVFLPSLRKRLVKLLAMVTLFAWMAVPTRAQFIGYTSPQSVQQTLAPAGTVCTGGAQTFVTQNLGQTQHMAILVFPSSVVSAIMQINATDTSSHTFPISFPVQAGAKFSGVNAIATASGYYPITSVTVTCTAAATFTLTYSGVSSTPPVNGGTPFVSLLDQQVFTGISGGSVQNSVVFQTPFGSSSGMLQFNYASAAVANSTLTALCVSAAGNAAVLEQFVYSIANTTGVQLFPVPPSSCPFVQVLYANGGAAGLISVGYIFDDQGMIPNPTLGAYTHVTATTATVVKATPGTFLGINVNTSAAGTLSIFDLPSASCTMTPSTNVVAVLTVNATDPPHATPFNVAMLNGICTKASAGMDYTVESQ